jgi:transposase
MTLRFPQERHELLQAARARQQTPDFREVYRARCGVEGPFAQTARNSGMRRARYIGQRKTHVQHLFTALATNILRLVRWLEGIPFAETRISRFAALAA